MYTMEDFQRDYAKKYFPKLTPQEQEEVLRELPPEALLAVLPPESRLAGLPPEARLAGLPPEARLAGLPPEARLAGLPLEARLAGLSEEQIQQMRKYLDSLTATHKPPARKPRRKK